MSTETLTKENRQDYWRANLKLLALLLTIWFTVSFGCGILFVDALNQVRIGGFKLGFWFAQQGAIYVFVVLIFVYVMAMNRLDEKYNVAEERIVKTPRRNKNIKH
jgi:putative solute:sodium symporter small subunit